LLGLDFIHQRGIVHRDIKLENILVSSIEGPQGEQGFEVNLPISALLLLWQITRKTEGADLY
jgi:serine/threonine protein kinase